MTGKSTSCKRRGHFILSKPNAKSIHCEFKKKTGFTDYAITSIEALAKGVWNSAKECLKLNIEAQEDKIPQLDQKIENLNGKLGKLQEIKQAIVQWSVAKKDNKPLPEVPSYPSSGVYVTLTADGSLFFCVDPDRHSKRKKKRRPENYKNEYLFELQYLDPAIKRTKRKIAQVKTWKHNLDEHTAALKKRQEAKNYSICFGGKKLMKEQYTTYAMRREDWLSTFRKKRIRGMMLAGRHDATQGNFMVRYDVATHTLIYKGLKGNQEIILKNVVFPYGQELIDAQVSASEYCKKHKKELSPEDLKFMRQRPVTWTIVDCGNAFRVQCTVKVPQSRDVNYCYSDGCVGFDMNYDNISYSETDADGRLLFHDMIRFQPYKKTSGQMENILSNALEVVFKHAAAVHKPVVMEDIKKVQIEDSLYGSKKRHRKVSAFAYAKMTQLAESKSLKYGCALKKIDPAYTSQIGKFKYMRPLGLSIHAAASYAIARRGMGFKDKVPKAYRHLLTPKRQKKHHWSQWAALLSATKNVPVHNFYKKSIDPCNFTALQKYAEALRA